MRPYEIIKIFNKYADCYSAYRGQPKAITLKQFRKAIKSVKRIDRNERCKYCYKLKK